jgi:hypothetical protein
MTLAEYDFYEMVNYARDRTARRARPRHRGIGRKTAAPLKSGGEVVVIRPDEVLNALETQRRIKLSRDTLLNWEKQSLIPPATRKRLGRGKGTLCDYPPETPGEVGASWYLMHGMEGCSYTAAKITNVRAVALGLAEANNQHDKWLAAEWLEQKYDFYIPGLCFHEEEKREELIARLNESWSKKE